MKELEGLAPEVRDAVLKAMANTVRKVAENLVDGAVGAMLELFPSDNIIGLQIARTLLNRAAWLIFSHPMNAGTKDSPEVNKRVEAQAAAFERHGIEFMANHVDNEEFDQSCMSKIRRILKSEGYAISDAAVREIMVAARGVWLAQPEKEKSE